MFSKKRSDALLALIRNGEPMTFLQKMELIFFLSIPSILAQVSSVLMFYIDASMVGSLGARASAAIGLVESATWLFGGLTMAASMGFSVQVAHFLGAKDMSQVHRVVRHGYRVNVALSVVIALIGVAVARPLPHWLGGGPDICSDATLYFLIFALATPFLQIGNLSSSLLKCSGDMRVPSLVSLLMCLLDVVFNFFLIYPSRTLSVLGMSLFMPGANLGVAGAALGSSLAIAVTALLLAWFARVRSPLLSNHSVSTRFVFSKSYVRKAFRISAPMAVQYVLMSGAQIVSIMIVAPLGNFAIAANTFAITAESLCYMPGYGIGEAATTLVGQSVGAQRRDLCMSFARMAVFTGMGVMAVMGALMYVFAPEMIGIMTPVVQIKDLGVEALRIEAFAEPMFGAAIVTYNVCLGAGDTLRPALINLCCIWGVRLTLAAWLTPLYGLRGMWMAMAMELSLRGLLFLVRLFSKQWMKIKAEPAKIAG